MPILLVTLPIISALDGKTDNHTEEKEIHTDATAQDTYRWAITRLDADTFCKSKYPSRAI